MTNTSFACTFDVTVHVFDKAWHLTCTASPKGFDCEPAILWLDNKDRETYWVPEPVWDAVELELRTGGPARVAFDEAMADAGVPFLAEAAE